MTIDSEARIEVLYLDEPNTYERVHYGHELTHAVIHQIEPGHRHLKLLEEGIAEALDQSERDLHVVYAQSIRAKKLSVADAVRSVPEDATSPSYPKAGSFVRCLLSQSPDPARFQSFWRQMRVNWKGSTPSGFDGAALDADGIDAMTDVALKTSYGIDLATLRARWKAELERRLSEPPVVPSTEDVAAITKLFAARDAAISSRDASAYRATLDGFYCRDGWLDDERAERSRKEANGAEVASRILEVLDTGIKNYPTVHVRFEERRSEEGRETTTERSAILEKFAVGYRFLRFD
jgi:hypothetical protein